MKLDSASPHRKKALRYQTNKTLLSHRSPRNYLRKKLPNHGIGLMAQKTFLIQSREQVRTNYWLVGPIVGRYEQFCRSQTEISTGPLIRVSGRWAPSYFIMPPRLGCALIGPRGAVITARNGQLISGGNRNEGYML